MLIDSQTAIYLDIHGNLLKLLQSYYYEHVSKILSCRDGTSMHTWRKSISRNLPNIKQVRWFTDTLCSNFRVKFEYDSSIQNSFTYYNNFLKQNQSLVRYLRQPLLINLSTWCLISLVIRMNPCKWSSVKRIVLLNLTFFINLYSLSQRKILPNTDDTNKGVFWFFMTQVTQY